MRQPPDLKNCDKIGIISPSRRITKSQISQAISTLGEWDLDLVIGENALKEFGYFAGTDSERRQDLQLMLDDPSIKAIFCSRGGYGMTKILDELDFTQFLLNPKWIIGFSDITALHLQLNKLAIQSIHGVMPVQFDGALMEDALNSLKRLLFEGSVDYEIAAHPSNKYGATEAEIIGGNLSLLVESLGTKSELDSYGKILFIEEIDEYLYKIDRMLNQLYRAGKFDDIQGLIVGQFTETKDTAIPFGQSFEDIVLNYFKDRQIPICFDFPIGHTDRNLAIPCGRSMNLKVSNAGVSLFD